MSEEAARVVYNDLGGGFGLLAAAGSGTALALRPA